jgi:hypothetical protein
MKSNWIMAVSPIEYDNLINTLKGRKIEILGKMDEINVLLINTSLKKAESLKEIEGVISVESEGSVTFQ